LPCCLGEQESFKAIVAEAAKNAMSVGITGLLSKVFRFVAGPAASTGLQYAAYTV
jgi:hypothetical protein